MYADKKKPGKITETERFRVTRNGTRNVYLKRYTNLKKNTI